MSPEQAKGKRVDKRADIWAFGVVLYETLTGERLYAGESVSEILASVIKDEPNLARMPAETPNYVRSLVRRCLTKDPNKRLRDIGEARIARARRRRNSKRKRQRGELAPASGLRPSPHR